MASSSKEIEEALNPPWHLIDGFSSASSEGWVSKCGRTFPMEHWRSRQDEWPTCAYCVAEEAYAADQADE